MRYLNFSIAEDDYGVVLENVREVIAFPEFTPIPNWPLYFLGIISLRDVVIPIIDLRLRLNIVPTLTQETAVIVCELEGKNLGIVVDVIHTVIAPDDNQIMKIPELKASKGNLALLKNIVKFNKQFILIIDIENIITAEDEALIQFQKNQKLIREAA